VLKLSGVSYILKYTPSEARGDCTGFLAKIKKFFI
jgi:hypothetical protein